jgi:hypothetical protein
MFNAPLTKKFLLSPSSPFSFTITANAGACDAPAGGASFPSFALAMQMQNSSKSSTPSLLESISLIMDSSSASVGFLEYVREHPARPRAVERLDLRVQPVPRRELLYHGKAET